MNALCIRILRVIHYRSIEYRIFYSLETRYIHILAVYYYMYYLARVDECALSEEQIIPKRKVRYRIVSYHWRLLG